MKKTARALPHTPRKRFGQHFLLDQAVIEQIVRYINPRPGQSLVEIGPGLGAITLPLLQLVERLTVVELDRNLVARLAQNPQLEVIAQDALKLDFSRLAADKGHKLRVLGNLPYNISSPLLFHLLHARHAVQDQHFMLQKEVVQRMVARPGTSAYGRLSVMLQAYYDIESFLAVGPQSFSPPPKVDSAVVKMVPKVEAARQTDPTKHQAGLETVTSFPTLEALVKVAFSQKRKLIKKTLGAWLNQIAFEGNFDLNRRAEEVPVSEYLNLAEQVSGRPGAVRPLTSSHC